MLCYMKSCFQMFNHRPNRRRGLVPLKRPLAEARTGLLRSDWLRMMMLIVTYCPLLRNKQFARVFLIKRNKASFFVNVFCTDLPSTAIWDEQSCPIFEPNHYETFPHFCQSTRTATTFSSPTS